jgi:hypothetical protein
MYVGAEQPENLNNLFIESHPTGVYKDRHAAKSKIIINRKLLFTFHLLFSCFLIMAVLISIFY